MSTAHGFAFLSAALLASTAASASPREIVLHATDGVTLFADWYRGAAPRRAALLIAPGHIQHKDKPDFRALAAEAETALGMDVLCLSLRGHGKSGGTFTFGEQEVLDVAAGLAEARREHPRVIAMGFSMGAAATLKACTVPGAADAAILVSCPRAFQDIWRRPGIVLNLFDWQPSRGWYFEVRQRIPVFLHRDFRSYAKELKLPVLFVHGDRDHMVPASHARELFGLVPGSKTFTTIPRGSHAQRLYTDDPPGFLDPVRSWLSSLNTLGHP